SVIAQFVANFVLNRLGPWINLSEAVVDQAHRGSAEGKGSIGVGLRGNRREPTVAHCVVWRQTVEHWHLVRRGALHDLPSPALGLIFGKSVMTDEVGIVTHVATHGR